MAVPYDVFTNAFLEKVREYELLELEEEQRIESVDGYMKRAISKFKSVLLYDLTTTGSDEMREFDVDIKPEDIEEIADIVSDGMIVQWLKPYKNSQDILENRLNTRDFTTYSPAELLRRVGDAYDKSSVEFVQSIREYSYVHGDLTDLHL